MLPVSLRVAALRRQRKITQTVLSKRSGVPQANLSRIEKGKSDPTVTTLLRVCAALQVSPAEFFSEDHRASSLLTRASVERIAAAVWDIPEKLSTKERELAALLKVLMPKPKGRRESSQRVDWAWQELKSRFSETEIRTLLERIEDCRARKKKNEA